MKLYLSSYLIPSTAELIDLIGKPLAQTSMLLVGNAQDYYSERVRNRIVDEVESYMKELGISVAKLDLREYNDLAKLKKDCSAYDLIWVMGGNTFVLRYEMRRSGFDKVIKEILQQGVVYGGDGAGALVAGRSIDGVELIEESELADAVVKDGLDLFPHALLTSSDAPEVIRITSDFYKIHRSSMGVIKVKESQAIVVKDGNFKYVQGEITEFKMLSDHAITSLEKSKDLFSPEESIQYRILAGLLTRFTKLFHAIHDNVRANNEMAALILLRSFFETGMTLEYLSIVNKEAVFQKFIRSAYVGHKVKNDEIMSNSKYDSVRDKYQEEMDALIVADGCDPDDVTKAVADIRETSGKISGGMPALMTMAAKIDRCAKHDRYPKGTQDYYLNVFEVHSRSVHTNWIELRQFHLKQDESRGGMLVPAHENNIQNPDYVQGLLLCVTFKTCSALVERYADDEVFVKRLRRWDGRVHKIFFNGS